MVFGLAKAELSVVCVVKVGMERRAVMPVAWARARCLALQV